MDLFAYNNYKKYVTDRIEGLPKRGYGQLKKMSEYLGVSSTFISQVFQGNKSLNLEQATLVAEFLGLNELETEYYLKLVLLERAGTEKLKKILKNEISKIKAQAAKIANRLQVTKVLADEHKAIFYSDWHYSAIRLLIGIKGYNQINAIVDHLNLSRKTVADAINFLVACGLLVKDGDELRVGPSRTHLSADSGFIKLHHNNWRQRALDSINSEDPVRLHYSAPMTLSLSDTEVVRAKLVKVIEDVGKVVDPSPAEELRCLNIDWFKVAKR